MEVYDILVILNENPSQSGPRKLLQGQAHALYVQNSNFWPEGCTDFLFLLNWLQFNSKKIYLSSKELLIVLYFVDIHG